MSIQLQLLHCLRASVLSPKEIEEFTNFLKYLDEEKISFLLKIFVENPEIILRVYKNIQAKEKAIKEKNSLLWDEIIDNEQMHLLKVQIAEIDGQ